MQRKGNTMRALNRRVLALEAKAKPMEGDSQDDEDAWCTASAERLEKAYAEHLVCNDPEPTADELVHQRRQLKELMQRLRAEDS